MSLEGTASRSVLFPDVAGRSSDACSKQQVVIFRASTSRKREGSREQWDGLGMT